MSRPPFPERAKTRPGTRKTLYSSHTLTYKQKSTKPKTLFYALTRSSHQKSYEKIAHNQGHLGLSKIKEMIRLTKPAKMTDLQAGPWAVVEADFCGPFPNGEYALVLTDQYSRYPEVEFTKSIPCEGTREKLKKIFSNHGVPQTIQTDGPPFTSHAFLEFARETGFQHKRITPKHPKAQGQVEGFNKLLNKITAIAKQANTNPHEAIHDMLQAYRSSPHPATKKTP